MIVDAVLGVLLAAVAFVVGLLPEAEPLGLSTAASGILYGYDWLNTFAPVTEILTAAGIYLGALVLAMGARAILTAYRLIPGKFT